MVILPDNQKHRDNSLAYLCNTWELQQGSECVSVQAQTSEAHNKLKIFSPELPPFFNADVAECLLKIKFTQISNKFDSALNQCI